LAVWFLGLRVVKRIVPMPILVRWMHRRHRGPVKDARQVTGCVVRAGFLVGAPARDCLERSLLLFRELSAAGWKPELVVGVRSEPGGLDGHAWVLLQGSIIGEPELDPSEFTQVIRFGDRGLPVRVLTEPAG
jgi:hypothetical protein